MVWGKDLTSSQTNMYWNMISIWGMTFDILPIAMGARLEDYAQVSPHKSFLHVDQFAGPRELAEYLLELDDEAYNQYFKVR